MTRWSRRWFTIASLAGMAFAAGARADVLAHWSFDELTGNDHDTFVDSSGNSTKHNALVADKGQIAINVAPDVPFGKAVTFTGKTGSYLDLPAFTGIYDHSFSIAVWVYLTKADHNYVLADWSPPLSMSFAFGFDTPKGNTNTDRITAWMKTDSLRTNKKKNNEKYYADAIKFTPAHDIPLNTWHHVAWVWDRQDDKNASLAIYLDGAKVDGTGLYKGSPATLLNNRRGPKIGLKQDTESTFHGSMDELWVFNDALTGEQVSNLMKTNDIAGAATFASATPATGPAAAAVGPAATPPAATAAQTPASTPSPDAVAIAQAPSAPTEGDIKAAPSPTPAATPSPSVSAPAIAAAPQTPEFTTAAPPTPPVVVAATPSKSSRHVAAAPVNEPKPDYMSTAHAAGTPLPSPVIQAVAVVPHRYSPERLLGLVGTGALALTLGSFLLWATMERSRIQQHRLRAR